MSTTPETIHWQHQPGQMPDADETVLLDVKAPRGGEIDGLDVWPGYWDGERWCWADGMHVAGTVAAWARLPLGVSC